MKIPKVRKPKELFTKKATRKHKNRKKEQKDKHTDLPGESLGGLYFFYKKLLTKTFSSSTIQSSSQTRKANDHH